MNRYFFYCLLVVFSWYLALPPATAQHKLPAESAGAPMLDLVAFPAAFTPVAAPLSVALPTAPTASLAQNESSLLRYALREAQLSWQFIKRLFRYEQ